MEKLPRRCSDEDRTGFMCNAKYTSLASQQVSPTHDRTTVSTDFPFIRAVVCILIAAFMTTGCFRQESFEEAKRSYAVNVESCVCRFLFWEEDNYSGLDYEAILDECNRVVHAGNPSRYDESLKSRPELDSLRCETEVKDWKAMMAEEERRRKIRQQRQSDSSEQTGKNDSQALPKPTGSATNE